MTPTIKWCSCDDNDNDKDSHKDNYKGKHFQPEGDYVYRPAYLGKHSFKKYRNFMK